MKDINYHFKPLQVAIHRMSMNHLNGLFVQSKTGFGKTYNIKRYSAQHGLKLAITTNITTAYLYRFFYENNRTDTAIYIKDFSKLICCKDGIEFLKSVLERKEDGKVLITNHKYSDKQDNIPPSFMFKGKVIADFNSLRDLKHLEDFEALESRIKFIHLAFSKEEIIEMLILLCKDEIDISILDHVLLFNDNNPMIRLNLRTFDNLRDIAAFSLKTGEDYESLASDELKESISDIQRMVYAEWGNKWFCSNDFKKMLYKNKVVRTIRTAERRINDYLELGEMFEIAKIDGNHRILSLVENEYGKKHETTKRQNDKEVKE